MEPLRLIAEQKGVFLRREATDYGYGDLEVAAAVRGGLWIRVRRGAYTFADIWNAADDVGRHRIRSRAVLRSLGGQVALSHTSALLEHEPLSWGVDLSKVHVTRLDGGAGRTEKDLVHHEGVCLDGDVMEKNGFQLMVPQRAVIESASINPTEAGLVTIDSCLHLGMVTLDELRSQFAIMQRWPKIQKVRLSLALADGRSESVGESRSRYLFWRSAIPAPLLQFEVYDASGSLAGISDFAWPQHRLLGEFDGKVKYGRLLQPGEESGDAVFREKVREDRLREITGWGMVRLVWADLYRPRETVSRLRRLMLRSAA